MRAAVYYSNNDIRIENVPDPKIGPGEVLVRIFASGICGSDVLEWYRRKKAPLVLGHEVAGEIVETGPGVSRWSRGQRVVLAHHVPCGICRYCLKGHETACETLRRTNFDPGGFAQLVRMPAINVERGGIIPLPDEVSYAEGAFAEPLACALRGLRAVGMKPGDSVLVIGCGVAGLLFIALARALGAGRILALDLVPYRLEAARRFGAESAIEAGTDLAARVRDASKGALFDRVLVCTASISANQQALECVDRGGTVLFFALTDPGASISLPLNSLFFRNEITLTTSYAGSPADYADAIELIRAGRVPVVQMITHTLPLEETARGFALVAAAQDSIKVMIDPSR